MNGTKAPPGVDLIQFEATSHVIPQCAMRVKRTQEMGPLLKNDLSTTPCGCYYEFQADTATSCTACTSAAHDAPPGTVARSSTTWGPWSGGASRCDGGRARRRSYTPFHPALRSRSARHSSDSAAGRGRVATIPCSAR